MTIIHGCPAAFHRLATSGKVPSASPGTATELTLPFSSFVAPMRVFSLQVTCQLVVHTDGVK